jgi:hypothetical protein
MPATIRHYTLHVPKQICQMGDRSSICSHPPCRPVRASSSAVHGAGCQARAKAQQKPRQPPAITPAAGPVHHARRQLTARHGCMRVNQHCVGDFWSDHVVLATPHWSAYAIDAVQSADDAGQMLHRGHQSCLSSWPAASSPQMPTASDSFWGCIAACLPMDVNGRLASYLGRSVAYSGYALYPTRCFCAD